jgi:hypothetical protein
LLNFIDYLTSPTCEAIAPELASDTSGRLSQQNSIEHESSGATPHGIRAEAEDTASSDVRRGLNSFGRDRITPPLLQQNINGNPVDTFISCPVGIRQTSVVTGSPPRDYGCETRVFAGSR